MMKEFKCEEFEIKVEETNNKIVMNWFGEAIGETISKGVMSYFDDILEELIGKEIQIDFRKLILMSTSIIQQLMKLFHNLETNKINTEIIYSKDMDWQRTAFAAVEKITGMYKHITITTG